MVRNSVGELGMTICGRSAVSKVLFCSLVFLLFVVNGCDSEKPTSQAPQPPPSPPQPRVLISEAFPVPSLNYKAFEMTLNRGTLSITISATSDIYVYIVDEVNFWKFKANEKFHVLTSKDRITYSKFEVGIPVEGKYYIVLSNMHSLFTETNVSLETTFTPLY